MDERKTTSHSGTEMGNINESNPVPCCRQQFNTEMGLELILCQDV